jgi:hypothetical protein
LATTTTDLPATTTTKPASPGTSLDATTTAVPSEPATRVIRGGAVLTMDPNVPVAEAVAVSGHWIVAVGTEAEIAAPLSASTPG